MKGWRLTIALVACVVATGCSQRVLIESVPSGATVSVNGSRLGRTPVHVRLSGATIVGGGLELRASLSGYREVHGPLDWAYDPRHLYALFGIFFPPSQLVHLHPQLHRRPLAHYRIILDEDLGEGIDRRTRIYGSDQLPEGTVEP